MYKRQVCPSCRAFSAQTHPDAITLGLTDGKKSIPVEEVRLLIRDAYIKPFMGTKKVYMIWDAHLMTAQAQNALLKLLEEPPAYVVFLLLCENISDVYKRQPFILVLQKQKIAFIFH